MAEIASFLEGIGKAIIGLFDFIVGFLSDLIYLVQLTGRVLGQLPSYLIWLPAEISALLLLILSIVIIYKILGR